MSRSIFPVVVIIGACILIIVLAKYSISSKAVPSLSEYMASTTGTVSEDDPERESTVSLKTPKTTLHIIVASSSETRARGLGGRTSLPDDYGMLFPFQTPGMYGFWMKDMHIPIDIVWIGSDKKVTGVTRNVLPDSYPTVYYPPAPISYVLEVNAGKAKLFGIATGTPLIF